MKKISPKEFVLRQPSYPSATATDPFYLDVANRLLEEGASHPFVKAVGEELAKRLALTLTDYLQDIVADAGMWRSFIDANMELYGFKVPFHATEENYIDYELNREDVRFLVWYVVAMLDENRRQMYPHDRELLDYADSCFDMLDSVYEESPVPEGYNMAAGLEFNDAEDHKAIYELGNWMFLHSYLLTPAFAESLRDIFMSVDRDSEDAMQAVDKKLEEAMMQDTTGPLALFMPEWVYLMLERKLPSESLKGEEKKEIHPYYRKFTDFTGGKTIMYFSTYADMNEFFIAALGWEKVEEHLSQVKGGDDYVLMVTPYKGMLMARDIARCIKDPENPLYDAEFARQHAFDLLTVRGICPGDLLRRIIREGWLPDAVFPGTDDAKLVKENADFIARCYLQIYYRGD